MVLTDLAQALLTSAAAAGLMLAITKVGHREEPAMRMLAVAFAVALTWRYAFWRIMETLPPTGLTVDFICGVVFLVVELLALLGSTLSLLFILRTINRSADVERNMSWLLDRPALPRVDVLICTYNEDKETLAPTIIAAKGTDYPNARIWVCDDGRREWLRELAEEHGCGYLTREDNAHAKAGNINNALAHLALQAEPPEFVAILDADFIAKPTFLARALALFRDERVGVVQTPQHFTNPDPIQHNLSLANVWPDEQRFFFDVVMPSKDAWGAAFCCGTSSVTRFSALQKIGGFPTDSVTEDYLLSIRLRQLGWKTVYLNERLSTGLAPEGLKEYITQRSRWCLGFMQICRGKDGPWWPWNGQSLMNRLVLLDAFLYWTAQYLYRWLGIVIPIFYLLLGVEAVQASLADAVNYFLPYYIAAMLCVTWLAQGRVMAMMTDVSQVLAVHSVLKAVFAGLFQPIGQKFKVTAKGGDRSQKLIQGPLLRVFMTYLALTIAGIAYTFLCDNDRVAYETSSIALYWGWYNILMLLLSCLICIEQPRQRRAERFSSHSMVPIITGKSSIERTMLDFSATGFCFSGTPPGPISTPLAVMFEGHRIPARIVRFTRDGFAVVVDEDEGVRELMFRLVDSVRQARTHTAFNSQEVAIGVMARVFQ